MYVCVCLAVTELEVEGAIACGAHTRDAVTRACGAGGDCGACHGMIETMIDDHQLDAQAAARTHTNHGPLRVAACSAAAPIAPERLVRRLRAA